MTIFPFRLVLNTGEVLGPEEIYSTRKYENIKWDDNDQTQGTGEVFVEIELVDGRTFIIPANEIRLDLATGMKDIYVNSRVKYHYGDDRDFYECEGTVSFYKGTLVVEWDDHTVQELYQYSQDNLTITGHVPFGEE